MTEINKHIIYNNINLYIPQRYVNKNLLNRFKAKTYESSEIKLIKKYFDKNDYVLDIGACLGYTTAVLANQCSYVIGVEANPELMESLELMKKFNTITNLEIVNCYLSNSKKNIDFQTYDLIVAGSGDRQDSAKEWAKTRKDYKIKCKNINEINNINKVNAVCIDCEGGEKEFLLENITFFQQIDKVVIELHGFLMKDKNFNQRCINTITSYGLTLKEKIGNSYFFKK